MATPRIQQSVSSQSIPETNSTVTVVLRLKPEIAVRVDNAAPLFAPVCNRRSAVVRVLMHLGLAAVENKLIAPDLESIQAILRRSRPGKTPSPAESHLRICCAWHKRNFGFELVMREGSEPTSHGICTECKSIALTGISPAAKNETQQGGQQ